MKSLPHLDIVLSVFNQENLIERVLYGIFKNTTSSFTLILVFDGCTDRTQQRAERYIKKYRPKNLKNVVVTTAGNVYETRANNIGFKRAASDFMMTLQDDMVIEEYGWERRLTYPLRKFDDVLAVSSRAALDVVDLSQEMHVYANKAGREFGTLNRTTFAVRDVINRGPVAFNMAHLRKLDYLKDNYAPSDLDDADLSLRAWKKYKLRVGAFWINYLSPLHWGKGRSDESTMNVSKAASKNGKQIMKDHADYLSTKQKHDEDIFIAENEIDYLPKNNLAFLYVLYRPFRIHRKAAIRTIKQTVLALKETTFRLFEFFGKKNVREVGIKKAFKIK